MRVFAKIVVWLLPAVVLTSRGFGGDGLWPTHDRPGRYAAESKIRVLIVDGFSNHNWRQTTALLRGILEPVNLFDVAVSTAPGSTNDPAWSSWRPVFSNYDVIPVPGRNPHERSIFVHADGRAIIGLPPAQTDDLLVGLQANERVFRGMEDVNAASGPHIVLEVALHRLRPGWPVTNVVAGLDGTGHGDRGDVLVHRLGEDPIHSEMARMAHSWLSPDMEVYYYARGPATNLRVLAYGRDTKPGQGLLWPVEWTTTYGKGGAYISTYGHVWNGEVQPPSLRCAAVQTIIPRAIQWLARRPITIPVPPDFPGTNHTSIRPNIPL